jgi:hypothetical protein
MPIRPPNAESLPLAEFFKARIELIKNFSDTAKTYIQISSAGLAIPVVFVQALLGKTAAERGLAADGAPVLLWLMWACFLGAIACGLIYQWLINRRLWDNLHSPLSDHVKRAWGAGRSSWMPHFENLDRSIPFGLMLGFFYVGAILFVFFVADVAFSAPHASSAPPGNPLQTGELQQLTVKTAIVENARFGSAGVQSAPVLEVGRLRRPSDPRNGMEGDTIRFNPNTIMTVPYTPVPRRNSIIHHRP